MATEHTAVGGASGVKLLVHISGWPLVGSWSDLHVGTLPGRKSADVASISAFPVAREREVYQTSASHSVGGFLTDLSCRVCAMPMKLQQAPVALRYTRASKRCRNTARLIVKLLEVEIYRTKTIEIGAASGYQRTA